MSKQTKAWVFITDDEEWFMGWDEDGYTCTLRPDDALHFSRLKDAEAMAEYLNVLDTSDCWVIHEVTL